MYNKLKGFLRSCLETFGALWVCIQISDYFWGEQSWVSGIEEAWWLFLIAGLIIGYLRVRPRRMASARIAGTDVEIEVRVKDIFSSNEAIIVGCNTTFEIRMDVISENSIQGQCTKRYFENERDLGKKVKRALQQRTPLTTKAQGVYGNLDEYEMGTTIFVHGRPRKIYLVAIARLNVYGTAESDDGKFLDALPKLWLEIRSRGGMDNLNCPILGSGHARLKMNRQQLIFELIRSFVAATRDGKVTERITFYISREDFRKRHIDMEMIDWFLKHACEQHPISQEARLPEGTPI